MHLCPTRGMSAVRFLSTSLAALGARVEVAESLVSDAAVVPNQRDPRPAGWRPFLDGTDQRAPAVRSRRRNDAEMDWNWLIMSENAPSNVVKGHRRLRDDPEFHPSRE